MSSPDLFVVCKNCQAEVSPYITECPYCGTRLRKRAPKLDRPEEVPKPPKRPSRRKPRATPTPKVRAKPKPKPERLGRLRSGEIPGIRGDEHGRPWATIVLVALSFGIWFSAAFLVRGDLALTALDGDPWRFVTASLFNVGFASQLAVVTGLGIFGWLLERRHGPAVVVLAFALCGPGALAVATAIDQESFVFGTHGAALGLLCAWLVPVLLSRRRSSDDDDADLLGVLVIAVVLLLVPAASQGSAIAGAIGGALGMLAGLALAALRPR
ncbi:MAG: rhomboid family intramembrane serine protease [Actinomycetota bacterium]|nr:rhomboid family intramembrane serine protease [Actinomycetota bacterium]